MANTTSPLLPHTAELLKQFGERLRLARLRRRLQARQVAERAGMTEVTLRRVERGMPGATIGAYLAVMQVLQLEGEIDKWGTEDVLGRHLQDTQTHGGMRPRRVRRKPSTTPGSPATAVEPAEDTKVNASIPEKPEDILTGSAVKTGQDAKGTASPLGVSTADLLKVIRQKNLKRNSGLK